MSEEKNTKLGNYLAYGMSFGLLGGVFISSVGMMLENAFLQIIGYGIGLCLGTMIGALCYLIKNKK